MKGFKDNDVQEKLGYNLYYFYEAELPTYLGLRFILHPAAGSALLAEWSG